MITLECGEHDSAGFANLEEAIQLAKEQGISNARGAINQELLWPLHSLRSLVMLGMSEKIPGVMPVAEGSGDLATYGVIADDTPANIKDVLVGAETKILAASNGSLPGWTPTKNPTGVRLVTMTNESTFYPHTDDYEGLVASLQLSIGGNKTLITEVNGDWVEEPILQGDITFFAGDTFSRMSRRPHGLRFEGACAIAFTLGQDPFYSISGSYPFIREHPEYFPPVITEIFGNK